jgi:two-component system, OmpR family, response regulator
MAKILLLEDDPVLGKGLQVHLQTAGYQVIWETHLSKARFTESEDDFDILLLDVNLPDGSGFDLCRDVRRNGSRLPILMLTARSDEDSVVTGFEAGANDYIRKPFSNRELLARIQSHLKEPFARDEQIRCGPVLVLIDQRKVMIDGNDMEFNRREFDIFVHLAKSPGTVLSREQLITRIDSADNILDRTIDSHFSHIRSKLKKKGIQNVAIRSVYGVGYTLEIP